MAVKFICDKCGKEIEEYNLFEIKIEPPEIVREQYGSCTDQLDLCPTCTHRLLDFIENK